MARVVFVFSKVVAFCTSVSGQQTSRRLIGGALCSYLIEEAGFPDFRKIPSDFSPPRSAMPVELRSVSDERNQESDDIVSYLIECAGISHFRNNSQFIIFSPLQHAASLASGWNPSGERNDIEKKRIQPELCLAVRTLNQ
jgi:hypothetical protein